MTYATELAAISRTPISLVTLEMDFCDRVFGTSPCLATGTKCFNTFPTCVYQTAYLTTAGKNYRFSTIDAPTPFANGERPYLQSVKLVPGEIKEIRTLSNRATVVIADEPDSDVGIDPYYSTRSSIQGTFWKKWLARNPNYKGRTMTIKDGFLGLAEGSWVLRFSGRIESITLGSGQVTIEAIDFVADFAELYWPPKVDIKTTFQVLAAGTLIYCSDVTDLPASGYVKIDDEVIGYTTKTAFGNYLSGLTRGAFGTTAADHASERKIGLVGYAPENYASQHIGGILAASGVSISWYDYTGLNNLWSKPDLAPPKFPIVRTEPTQVSKILGQLCELGEMVYFTRKDGKIYFKRIVPNEHNRTIAATLTDEANIVRDSVSIDLADDKRVTRWTLAWDFNLVGDTDDLDDYHRISIVINATAELPISYGEPTEKQTISPWLRQAVSYATAEQHDLRVANMLRRWVWFNVIARPIIRLRTELKDSALDVGDYVRLTTNELQDIYGNGLTEVECMITKIDRSKDEWDITMRRLPSQKIAIIAPNTSPIWTNADADDKEYAFISNNAPNLGKMDQAGTDGYYIG